MILAALALATSVPSFDCAKASTNVEKMICNDPELSAADQAVVTLYAGLPLSKRRVASKSLSGWLRERNRCHDRGCLLQAYEERLVDAFEQSTSANIRTYKMKGNPSGTLEILDIGTGWSAFFAQADWIGPIAATAPEDTADQTEVAGVFRLGRGSRAPRDEFECGWKIRRLRGDRWKLEDWPGTPGTSCGARNASVQGVYKR